MGPRRRIQGSAQSEVSSLVCAGAFGQVRRVLLGGGLLCAALAPAQELEFPISPSPVGSGARAAGMADAFVAVADDATAASWNPAGLVQLERPEFSVVGAFNAISEDLGASPDHPEFPSTQRDSNIDLNFMSLVYPLPSFLGGRNATVSLSIQQKYDLSRSLDVDFLNEFELLPGVIIADDLDFIFDQDGSLNTITPAFAFELTRRLSLGVAVNIWGDTLVADSGWDQEVSRSSALSTGGGPATLTEFHRTESYDDFRGENYVVGLLWNVTKRLNFGLRYDSTLKADVDFSAREVSTQSPDPVMEFDDREVRIPDTWAFGIAFRQSDRLTVSADVSITDWDDFLIEHGDGTKISLVDASNLSDPDTRVDYDTTRTIRIGAEYVFIPKRPKEILRQIWSLRGGIFYDEEPASGRSTTDPSAPGDGEADQFYGFAIGAGVQALQRLNFDVAYQFRYGNNVNSDFVRGVPGFSEDVFQHRILVSSILYF